jgi:parallel beta-helix repeat protein
VIRLWGTVGSNESVVLYKEIDPETDFEFSLQVNATTLAGFAIMLRSSLPFVGSTQGVNLEFGARDNGTVLLARWVSSWTWNIFVTDIENNTWYTLKLGVHKSPFNITAEAFSDNGTLLGFYSASDMTNLSFDDIEYLGFGVLESGGDYAVRNFNFSGISRTWIVDSEGFGDATSIQTAIDNASAEDTIFVRQGTYYEHLTVNKTLTLMGENRANTIIDAGGTEPASVVVVSASNVVIRGFTIQNSRSGGNAIWIDGVFNNTIKDNVIQKNGDGTKILHSSGNLILDNYFINNTHTAIGFD